MRPMRKADRETSREEALALLQRAEYGVLGTVDGEGQPYGVPLSYVLLDGSVYFHCARAGHKLDNIKENPRVSFTVVADTQPVYDTSFTTYYSSAILFGVATSVEDEAERYKALRALCEKYLPGAMQHFDKDIAAMPVTEVVRVDFEALSGKAKHKA